MKGINNFLDKYFSYSIPLNKRILNIMCICGVIANSLALVGCLILSLPIVGIIMTVISLCIMIILTVFARGTEHPKGYGLFVTFMIANVMFPIIFITQGGVRGGMPCYFMITPICIAFTLHRKWHLLLVPFSIIEFGVLIYLSYIHPDLFYSMPCDKVIWDIISAFSIVFIFETGFCFLFARQCEHDRLEILKLNELYERQAHTDELTGLNNRRYFKSFLDMALPSLKSSGKLNMAIFDIDDFKKVNDVFGHPYGDKVLREFALILSSYCKDGSICCRYGGEEFLMFIPNKTIEEAHSLMEDLLQSVRSTIRLPNSRFITVSCGLHHYEVSMTYQELLDACDEKLYIAKANGKDQVVYL